jgi:hypothetical protein
MNASYFKLLKDDTKDQVLEIESFIEKEIEIEVQASEREILACNVEGDSPKIILPRDNYFPDSSVLHELIHIRRFLVEGVPSLTVSKNFWSKNLEQGFLAIDNDLEHLHVIKEEVSRRPNRVQRWLEALNQTIFRVEQSSLTEIEKDCALVRLFLLLEIAVMNQDLSNKARKSIKNPKINSSMDEFLMTIKEHLNSKEDVSKLLIDLFELQKFYPCLEYRKKDGSILQQQLF